MKYVATVFSLLLFFTATINAQTTDESAEKQNRWHFAINAGTHYLRSHYNGYYYNDQNPREAFDDDVNVIFKGTPGIWIGGNINYKLNENWYLSSEIALHSLRLAYSVHFLNPIYGVINHEQKSHAFAVTLKPISVTRCFNINDNWHIPVNLGGHLITKVYGQYYKKGEFRNPPNIIVIEDKGFDFRVAGAGIVLETGITKSVKNGELSFLVVPTPRLTYTTGRFWYYPYVYVTGSGAIVKVQYAFK